MTGFSGVNDLEAVGAGLAKTRGKDSATNSKPSIKIWHKFQILKGLAGTDNLAGHVIYPWFKDRRDFPHQDANLRRAEIGQDTGGQEIGQRLDQMEVAAPANFHNEPRHLRVVK